MMMMITKEIAPSPFITETVAPMSAFNAACHMSCASAAVTMKTLSPKGPLPDQSPTKKRKCTTKVAFGSDITLAFIESAFEFTQEEKDERWYRSSQISSFKMDARNLCRKRLEEGKNNRSNSNGESEETTTTVEDKNVSLNESTRGLEVYYPSRQRYGKKFIQHVLEAYHVRCVGNDVHVALLAEKWSKKSLNRAYETGKRDFMAAYFPEDMDIETLPEEKPLLTSALRHSPQIKGRKSLA